MTGSTWLSSLWAPPEGDFFFLRDAFLNSLFLGYEGSSVLELLGWKDVLNPISQAYVAPLWTLSIEVQGSALVLLVVLCRQKSMGLFWVALSALAVIFIRTHFICFIFGCAITALRENKRRGMPLYSSIPLLIFGAALCVLDESGQFNFFSQMCNAELLGIVPCTPHPQKVVGALLIFVALYLSWSLHKLLAKPALARLGRLSLSIYLVHWPVIFGIASAVLISIQREPLALTGRLIACMTAFLLAFAFALMFVRVDDWAISLARRFRRAASGISGPAGGVPVV